VIPDPKRSIGFLIGDVSRLLRRRFDRRVQPLGLTQAQWRAIIHLAVAEGMKQGELAERLDIKPITLGRLVDRMQAAGWIERHGDPDDRRAVRLYLSEKSRPVLVEMRGLAAKTLEEALAGLSGKARGDLINSLLQMKQNLTAAEAIAARGNTERTAKDVRERERNARGRTR
jgi:MarR family transcriptional regulator, transcriptional regulator for hemolysin